MKISNYILETKEQTTPKAFIEYWQFKVDPKNKESVKLTVEQFMEIVSGEKELSNIDTIWATYDDLEKEQYKNEYSSKNLPYIKPATKLAFPIKDSPLILEEVAKSFLFLKQQDFLSYWSENMEKLIKDPKYVPDNIVADDEDAAVRTKVQPLNVRVWIYCKAIDSIIDVSQYVMDCNIDKSFQNGSFTINVAPFKDAKTSGNYSGSYWDIVNVTTKEGYDYKTFLEKVVQINDIVFIRFERLKLERERDSILSDDIIVSPNNLANTGTNYNVWDMIGFVDGSSETYSSEENSKTTSIFGRDISKLFVEDGSYFIPLIDINNSKQNWVYLGRPQDSWYKRNIITGNYDFLWSYKYKSINEILWFVINVMSNIGVCKNDLFQSWGDKRIQSYEVEGQESMKVNGIWQIVKTFISPEVQQRIVVDSSIGNPNGTLMDYVNRACQYPFVEFFFDTYINTIDLIVRQPPFTEAAIMGAFKNSQYITITPDNVISYNLSYDSRVYSWFQVHVQNNNLIGDNESTNLAFVPIVYLNEYAELWGNRKLEINDMYCQMKTINGTESKVQFSTMQSALLNDLIYLVESNAYLPFTRTGTIEINGDRRIKVGTFVLNESTNEFFYVLSVSNSVSFSEGSLDRRTILQVERGMYVPILERTASKSIKRLDNSNTVPWQGSPSYFKIVNLDELKKSAKQAESGNLTTATSPLVDQDQFKFFLNRKMYGGLV
jgi:hypothetical protein